MKKIFANKKIIKIIIFLLYMTFNIYLMIEHEPWRDEAHAWLMAKNLSIKDLFLVSKYDGHPILWHLLLMPFAKLGFPYITLSIINIIICFIAAYIFYYKVEINDIIKSIIMFGAPFIYVYTVIARNYCLILLFCVLVAYIYKDRYKKTYKYTLLLCLLLNTPTIAWGLSIALFIFYEVEAIYNLIKKNVLISKGTIIKSICIYIGVLLFVCYELYGTSNPDFPKQFSYSYKIVNFSSIYLILLSSFVFLIVSLIINKKIIKEYFICLIALLSQVFIILFFYPSVLEPRLFYQCIVWLMFIIIISSLYKEKKYIIVPIVYLLIYLGSINTLYGYAFDDIKNNYSNSKETATWINKNLDTDEILIDKAIFCQSIVPYLKNKKVYDIYHEKYFEDLKYYSDREKPKDFDLSLYDQKYIIVYDYSFYDKYKKYLNEIYSTTEQSITGENYTIYKIDIKINNKTFNER